jgi:hypothetical protein
VLSHSHIFFFLQIPFDQITDCDIVEPAGNTCGWIPNTLFAVHVDTASSGGDKRGHELTLYGLKDPDAFKRLVWAMKRLHYPTAHAVSNQDRGGAMENDQDAASTAVLLREIRDELRALRTTNLTD